MVGTLPLGRLHLDIMAGNLLSARLREEIHLRSVTIVSLLRVLDYAPCVFIRVADSRIMLLTVRIQCDTCHFDQYLRSIH